MIFSEKIEPYLQPVQYCSTGGDWRHTQTPSTMAGVHDHSTCTEVPATNTTCSYSTNPRSYLLCTTSATRTNSLSSTTVCCMYCAACLEPNDREARDAALDNDAYMNLYVLPVTLLTCLLRLVWQSMS